MPTQYATPTLLDDDQVALWIEGNASRPFESTHEYGPSTVRRDVHDRALFPVRDHNGTVASHGHTDGI